MNDLFAIEFIKEIYSCKTKEERDRVCLQELKFMAQSNQKSQDSKLSNINKKLFMQLIGYPIDEIEFVKAIAEECVEIKKSACLGVVGCKVQEKGILLHSIITKDIKNNIGVVGYLNLIGNSNQVENNFSELMQVLEDINNDQVKWILNKNEHKMLIIKGKYNNDTPKLIDSNNRLLFIKLQLIEKNKVKLNDNEILYLIKECEKQECTFTLTKLIQCLIKNINNSDLISVIKNNTRLLSKLESLIVKQSERVKKQVEIALSLEICALFSLINNFTPNAENFIQRLICSINENSRCVGINFSIKYSVLKDYAVRQCVVNINVPKYKKWLINLIDLSNYRDIYQNIGVINKDKEIILKIFNISDDYEFKKELILHVPSIYHDVYDKIKLNPMDFIDSTDINHFSIIYKEENRFTDDQISHIIDHHIKILTKSELSPDKFDILYQFFAFTTTYGNIEENRNILLKYSHIKEIIPGILLFNLVLNEKIAILGNILIPYRLRKNALEVEQCTVYDGVRELIPSDNDVYYDISDKCDSIYIELNGIKQMILK